MENDLYTIGVVISYKDGIQNPLAIGKNAEAKSLGFDAEILTAGRYFQLSIRAENEEEARNIAADSAKKLLANPVIETYKVLDNLPIQDNHLLSLE